MRDNINKVLSMNSKKRKVEIQDNSSDEFPIRVPGKTWAIKLAKSYWQHVPVSENNSGGKSSYIQKSKQRINPDAAHSRINFNPGVTSTPLDPLLGKIHIWIKPNLDRDRDLLRGWHTPHRIQSVCGEIIKENHHHPRVHLVKLPQ